MIAEFYILKESFAYNHQITKNLIESKIKALARDIIYIKQYSETNKFFVHPDTYNVEFFNNLILSDLLYNPNIAKQHIDRDVYNSLQKILIESATTSISSREIIEALLPLHNQEICHGLIAFNLVEGIDSNYQVVYDLNGWFKFRQYYLALYPKDQNYFIDECCKYFQNLYFHPRNKQTIGDILDECHRRIIFHLSALNNSFRLSQLPALNRTQVLEHFSRAALLDGIASLEGNAVRKEMFTFSFENDDEEIEEVCCEPHLKLCYNDNYPGDQSYSNDRRIYFHEGVSNIQNGKILIGHIGRHL